jgi:hypothetical protein
MSPELLNALFNIFAGTPHGNELKGKIIEMVEINGIWEMKRY